MRIENLIICVLCVSNLLPAVRLRGAEESEAERQERIENYIAERREGVERYIAGQLLELELKTIADITALEVGEQAEFSPVLTQARIANSVLILNGYRGLEEGHLSRLEKDELRLVTEGRYQDQRYTRGLSTTLFALTRGRLVSKKNRILGKSEYGKSRLELHRQALHARLDELERRLKEEPAVAAAVEAGVISGILYSDDNPSALIGRELVHEGDSIDSVEVVRIGRSFVEFEKDGRRWSQGVGEEASRRW
jgi:hypothetical protein